MVSADPRKFWRDEQGAALVEMTVAILGFFVILFGIIEFSLAFYQWNAATKAMQWGARRAVVSAPVAPDIATMTGLSETVLPGDQMPYFNRLCESTSVNGATGRCNNNDNNYSAAAMRAIVFGSPTNTACVEPPSAYRFLGMCNFFYRITPQNVVIRYEQTGLGYAGRPGGPVPTITVSLKGLTYDFVFLDNLLGLGPITMPALATTVTGEDLRNSGS